MQKQNFNRDWTVKKLPGGTPYFSQGGRMECEERNVTLPHDAMIWEGRDANNPSGSSGGYFAGGEFSGGPENIHNFEFAVKNFGFHRRCSLQIVLSR